MNLLLYYSLVDAGSIVIVLALAMSFHAAISASTFWLAGTHFHSSGSRKVHLLTSRQ